jgi:hypothetical protein
MLATVGRFTQPQRLARLNAGLASRRLVVKPAGAPPPLPNLFGNHHRLATMAGALKPDIVQSVIVDHVNLTGLMKTAEQASCGGKRCQQGVFVFKAKDAKSAAMSVLSFTHTLTSSTCKSSAG